MIIQISASVHLTGADLWVTSGQPHLSHPASAGRASLLILRVGFGIPRFGGLGECERWCRWNDLFLLLGPAFTCVFPSKFEGGGWRGLSSSVEHIIIVRDSISDSRTSQLSPVPPVARLASSPPHKVLDLHILLLSLHLDLPGLRSLIEGSSLWKSVHQVSPASTVL